MGVWSQVGCGLPLTRVQLAWAVFDAGSFGFYSVTYNTYVPIWFAQEAGQQGISPHMATAKWGYSVACAMLRRLFSDFAFSSRSFSASSSRSYKLTHRCPMRPDDIAVGA